MHAYICIKNAIVYPWLAFLCSTPQERKKARAAPTPSRASLHTKGFDMTVEHPPRSVNTDPATTVVNGGHHLHLYDLPDLGLVVFLHDWAAAVGYLSADGQGGRSTVSRLRGLDGIEVIHPTLEGLKALRKNSPALPQRRARIGLPVVPVNKIDALLDYKYRPERRRLAQDWLAAIRKSLSGAQQELALESEEEVAEVVVLPRDTAALDPRLEDHLQEQVVEVDWSALLDPKAPTGFPVAFEPLWRGCGYGRKDSAVTALRASAVEGLGFSVVHRKTPLGTGGRPSDEYYLTERAARHFAMQARTPGGEKIRDYFIDREEEALAARVAPAPGPIAPSQDPLAVVEHGIQILERLGGVDDRRRLFLQDATCNAISKLTGTPLLSHAPEAARGWTVGERITHLGYRYSLELAQAAGRRAAQIHRRQLGQEAPTVERYVDGAVRQVKFYAGERALAVLDEAIAFRAAEMVEVRR